MSITKLASRLKEIGLETRIDKNTIFVSVEDDEIALTIDKDFKKTLDQYFNARGLEYDSELRTLVYGKNRESALTRLSQGYLIKPNYTFTDKSRNTVIIGSASDLFRISFFMSEEFQNYYDILLKRKLEREKKRKSKRIQSFQDILWNPYTAQYTQYRKIADKEKLKQISHDKIESCLFKLSVDFDECWEQRKKRKKVSRWLYDDIEIEEKLTMPNATYDNNLIKYYKVAKSSKFPSQSFLSYYHVLEYFFLKVSDESLYTKVKSCINETKFETDHKHIDKIIVMVKSHNEQSDETEMLKNVIAKYVSVDELIDFINDIEKKAGDQIYTKKRNLFGEQFEIKLNSGHVVGNTSKVIKHIRNALVHSTDKYKREECHLPLTETEYVLEEFIPLIRFLAERIIFSTAN